MTANDNYSEIIRRFLSLTEDERDNLVRWYSRQPEQVRLYIGEQQTRLMRKQHADTRNLPVHVRSYIALLSECRRLHWLSTKAKHQKTGLSTEEARLIDQLGLLKSSAPRPRKKHTPAPIRTAIDKRLYQEILKRRNDGLGWRRVAKYLEETHNLKVSHTYLKSEFERLKDIRDERN